MQQFTLVAASLIILYRKNAAADLLQHVDKLRSEMGAPSRYCKKLDFCLLNIIIVYIIFSTDLSPLILLNKTQLPLIRLLLQLLLHQLKKRGG